MEIVLAKLLKKSEGPANIFHPNSVWNHSGKQFGAAFTSKGKTDELDSFFELDFENNPEKKKEYLSQTYLNFDKNEFYLGKVNWTKTKSNDPHIHFKGYWQNKSLQENFYPKKTILIIRKINSEQFDTYFINDNDPFFNNILEKIKTANSHKTLSQRDSGFVFLNIDFSTFEINDSEIIVETTMSSRNQYRRSSDPKRRKATELYAEKYIKDYLEKKGYNFIKKYGAPYDLQFSKDNHDVRVEVKGSTLQNISSVDVTENEILHSLGVLENPSHAQHEENTTVYIALVENITINENYEASGGELVHFDFFKTFSTTKWREYSEEYFGSSDITLETNCKFKLQLDKKIILNESN